jgi:putative nucleotidyltransferase with HDIG domain
VHKRIKTEELCVGMYIHELCGSWMDHPFWSKQFLLKNNADLQRILASGIKEVWIDTRKGSDFISMVTPAVDKASARLAIDQQLLEAASEIAAGAKRVQMADEMARASRICSKAKGAVKHMFHEARLGKAIDTAEMAPLVQEISDSVTRNPGAIVSLARLKTRDEYTYMHSVAVCALMVALAKELQLDDEQVHEAGMAGLLHDLGKALIDKQILNKPGKLTDKEFDIMRRHPELGTQMLREGKGVSEQVLDVCLHHHEKMDGSGYPEKLAGDQISLFARMGAICDVYDAITSTRAYKNCWDPAESLRKMTEWSGSHFDKSLFQHFVKTVGIYPTGSLVRLKSGRLGIVLEQNPSNMLSPSVKVFFSTTARAHIKPEILDLAKPDCAEEIQGCESPEKWGFKDLHDFWAL